MAFSQFWSKIKSKKSKKDKNGLIDKTKGRRASSVTNILLLSALLVVLSIVVAFSLLSNIVVLSPSMGHSATLYMLEECANRRMYEPTPASTPFAAKAAASSAGTSTPSSAASAVLAEEAC